jgi:hypothetical protein
VSLPEIFEDFGKNQVERAIQWHYLPAGQMETTIRRPAPHLAFLDTE